MQTEAQKNLLRLLRTTLVDAQEFSEEMNMSEWAKPFVSHVFSLCSAEEQVEFRPLKVNEKPAHLGQSPSKTFSDKRFSSLSLLSQRT